jgi:hypothetical protein
MQRSWRKLTARGARNGWLSLAISVASGLVLLFAFLSQGSAAPPANAELQNRAWFESLEQPGERHLLCCSIADCRVTSSRASPQGYEVAIENAWIAVPADRVLQNVSNPTGRAVVCYRRVLDPEVKNWELRIFCFVRPTET